MGVVNVTPDSFSDGGRWFGAAAAIQHGLELVAQGADIVDVGGESTRPGAQRISADEELRRVMPVITELVRAGVVVSVDTMRAQVAECGARGGRQPGQRRQRRARRPVHAPAGGEGRRALRRHALARAQPRHGQARRLPGRGPRGARRARPADRRGDRRGRRPVADRARPRARASARCPTPRGPDAHNWQLLAQLREVATSAAGTSPCSSAPPASGTWAGCSTPAATPRPFMENDDADGRRHRAGRRGRRLVRAGAPGPRQRGRGAGSRRLTAARPARHEASRRPDGRSCSRLAVTSETGGTSSRVAWTPSRRSRRCG